MCYTPPESTYIHRYVHSRDEKKQEAVRSVNEMLVV